MRIVIDTNVLIASLISKGFCQELVEHCLLNHTVITSEFILTETEEKLIEKFNISRKTTSEAISTFRLRMEVVAVVPLSRQVCRDLDDDNILATALTGKSNLII